MSRVRKHRLLSVSAGDLVMRGVSAPPESLPHEVSFPMCGERFIIVSVHISGSTVCVWWMSLVGITRRFSISMKAIIISPIENGSTPVTLP